jgi:hypothetical protein
MEYLVEYMIFENKKYLIELIEDCFLGFCEEYDQRIEVEDIFLTERDGEINYANSLHPSLLDTFKKMCLSLDGKNIQSHKGYKVTLLRKGVGINNSIG